MTDDARRKSGPAHGRASGRLPLVSVQTEVEAAIIVAALREKGVDAACVGGHVTGSFRADGDGHALVIVPIEQLEHARTQLEAIRQESRDLDWSQVDIGTSDEGDETKTT